MNINDWAAIQGLWDKLIKQLDKVRKVGVTLGTPRAFIKILAELEDFLNKTLAGKQKFFFFFFSLRKFFHLPSKRHIMGDGTGRSRCVIPSKTEEDGLVIDWKQNLG